MKMMTHGLVLSLALMLGLTTGCASGGYKLTRDYARFVNSKQIIIRIILYIFTSFVFAITLLVDMVIFNTMDFWQGRVSQGTYEFKDQEKNYHVNHRQDPHTQRRSSHIVVSDLQGKQLQDILLTETEKGSIQMWVDGTLRTEVESIDHLPVAKHFNEKGQLLQRLPLMSEIAKAH